ncbi:golgin subfamily A member 6-like protein 22 isoform X1 [Lytechinus variegatus]|uniref:golgin subfamily A member 6-like protein 22 isoform X1 n=1 Tax=Lytechinus variegatus TaxID=7654 RepID=UPI001BB2AC9F|nr:golgin subfamily A member 6-like protein 22 isoform X1 [Lytechinus variegatus]
MAKNWGKVKLLPLTEADGRMESAHHVNEVFELLEFNKHFRVEREIIIQLTAIHSRVQAALEHFGVSGKLELTEEEIYEEELRRRRPPGFLTTKMKQEKLNKQRILDTIHEFGQKCITCERNMEEVNDWLFDVQTTLESNLVTEETLKDREKDMIQLNQDCSQIWADGTRYKKRHNDKLRRLGKEIFELLNELMQDHTQEDSDDEGEASSHHVSQPIDKLALLKPKVKRTQHLISDEQTLKEIENWKSAAKDVEGSLDAACRMARTNNDRTAMRNAVKKFNFMMLAMERRNQENSHLGQQILECEVKINHVSRLNEKHEVEMKKKTQRMEQMENIIKKNNEKMVDLQHKLKESRMEISSLKTKLESQISEDSPKYAAQFNSLEKEKVAAVAKCKELEGALVNLEDHHKKMVEDLEMKYKNEADTVMKLERVVDNLESELRETLQTQEEYAHQLDLAEYQKMDGKNQTESLREQYKTQIKDLKKDIDDLHREISSQKAELDSKEAIIDKQEQKISELGRQVKEAQRAPKVKEVPVSSDASTNFKQRLTSIKGDYESEINKLKDYLDKEKSRFLAEKRRQEQDIKMQLGNIHKESIHMMRAINRFKESIAVILEKESLLDTAHEIRQMDNLIIDEKVATDIRRSLNQLAGNAMELLVSLELKIAQALMNKRIELKEAITAKVKTPATPPSLDSSVDVDKLCQENQQLNERILKYQDQMNAAQVSFEEMKRINEEKYNALLERHKTQILHASNLQRELRSLEVAFREEVKKRDAKLRNMRMSQAQQERNQQVLVSRLNSVEEQPRPALKKPNVEQMRMKVSDQLKNLNMLEEAFKENKISQELHTITVNIITQTMEVPEIRLRSLFERYITFRRLQEQKKELFEKIKSEKEEEKEKDQRLTSFLERMEKRMCTSINKWRDRRELLKQQRTQLYEQMIAIFDAVSQEAGISMIRPTTATFRPYKPPSRRRKHKIPSSGVHMDVPVSMDKESVIGTSMALLGEPGPFWRMPANWEATTALVTVPRMLDMDVNTRRKTAQDVLLRLGKGSAHRNINPPRNNREPSIPPIASLFPPISK